jgi:citrate synthase
MLRVLNRSTSSLRQVVEAKIAEDRERLSKLKKPHGNTPVDQITVEQLINGMQGVKAILCQTSRLDPYQGIKFRGLTIPECQAKLPAKFREPLPESMFWLLLTGQVPTNEQVEELRQELSSKASLPSHIKTLLNSLPKTMHPMTQFSIGVMALGGDSQFNKLYEKGMRKGDYWKPMLEDGIDLVAKVPALAATIYNNLYRNGVTPEPRTDSDWAENYVRMLGWENQNFFELMRLHLTIHCDHEGGNVCTHTAHLTASALTDLYKSFAAGLNGLAGPLHGLASSVCLTRILEMHKVVGENPTEAAVEVYVRQLLMQNEKMIIFGFGHTVLKEQDPRFTALQDYAKRFASDCSICKLVEIASRVTPRVLKELKGMKNPHPTLNFNSGALLYRFGLKELDFFTVNFGVSRVLGVTANLVWDKALGMPIERPASLTLENLEEFGRKN